MPASLRGKHFPLPLTRVREAPGPDALRRYEARKPQQPQRLLREAAEDAARMQVPQGLGLDSAAVRQRMVASLRAAGVADEAVLDAFGTVERHRFVDSALANQAYEDTALPIGHGQTISKPSVVARMLFLLRERDASSPSAAAAASLRPARAFDRVLEIGSGCGYQAALLSRLAREVVSIERIGELAQRAHRRLAEQGIANVQLVHGDGRSGHAARAPYDAIISAAGAPAVPQAWLDQLAPGGRLITPWHDRQRSAQVLLVVDRHDGGFTRRVLDAVHFVPLKSGAA